MGTYAQVSGRQWGNMSGHHLGLRHRQGGRGIPIRAARAVGLVY